MEFISSEAGWPFQYTRYRHTARAIKEYFCPLSWSCHYLFTSIWSCQSLKHSSHNSTSFPTARCPAWAGACVSKAALHMTIPAAPEGLKETVVREINCHSSTYWRLQNFWLFGVLYVCVYVYTVKPFLLVLTLSRSHSSCQYVIDKKISSYGGWWWNVARSYMLLVNICLILQWTVIIILITLIGLQKHS